MYLAMSEKENDCRKNLRETEKIRKSNSLRYFHQRKYVHILMKKVFDMDKQMKMLDTQNWYLKHLNSELQSELECLKDRVWQCYGYLK